VIIGSATDPDEALRAAVWDTDGKVVDLNSLLSKEDAAQWTLEYAVEIIDQGVIIGVGVIGGECVVFELR
jgi:hypothetical protein